MLSKLKHFINPYIRVKKSGIHSKGVFAKKNIKKDTRIIEYLGREITHQESELLYDKMLEQHKKDPKKPSVYTFSIDDEKDLDGDVWWNLAKYVNHSCSPNCESMMEEDNTIALYALRDIKKGEELSFNYGYDVDSWEEHPCYCGFKNCVGHIVSEDQWDKLEKLKKKDRE